MFTQHQIDELIRLGWAPEYDDQLRIVGFDKWVNDGDPVLAPVDCGRLVQYAEMTWDLKLMVVIRRKYGLLPNKAVRYA